MSGYLMESVSGDLGEERLLSKPFTSAELTSAVRETLVADAH
jgi:hypothetical protein